jgi:hypothetical protein
MVKYFCDKDGCGKETSDSKILRTFVAEDGQRYTIELMVRNPEGKPATLCVSCARDILLSDV